MNKNKIYFFFKNIYINFFFSFFQIIIQAINTKMKILNEKILENKFNKQQISG